MDNLLVQISTNLKSLRKQHGWSLDVTSNKTGVSKAMLGQIERGESSPTIATLWKIASGFEVSFSSFLDSISPDQTHFIHRNPHLQQIHKEDDKINVMSIFPYDKSLMFEVFIVELLPGGVHLSPAHHKNIIEHLIPVNGEIEVLIEGTWKKVRQNEGVRFSADLPHGYRNLSNKPVLFHAIIHYKN